MLGPFTILGPILGFPVVFLFTIISVYTYRDTDSYLKKMIKSLIVMFIIIGLILSDDGLAMIAIGMLFQAVGVILSVILTPLFHTRLTDQTGEKNE
jgi:hypothetical protein